MGAKVLGSYVAVVPDEQGNQYMSGNLIITDRKVYDRYLSGTIIAVGTKIPEGFQVGQRVLYERMSGHPGQSAPIDASVFGGEEGKMSVLIPIHRSALKSMAELDEELDKRRRDVEEIERRNSRGEMSKHDHERLVLHERRLDEIKREQSKRGRAADIGKIYDKTRGAGVVAIIGE